VSTLEVTGIVLAGGRATRFGADKLASLVNGRPLLHLAIHAVASVSDEVVVAIGADGRRPPLPADSPVHVRVVRDAVADGGPLAGLAAGLTAARGRLAILVGGDQPSLSPPLLAELLLWLDREAVGPPLDAVALVDEKLVRPLPAALRVSTCRPIAAALLDGGTRSLVGLLGVLRVGTLEPERWRVIDPGGASLRDVDTPDEMPAQ
jgi:molybdopterin-guanine dinucleotide biosynthesis protein A